MAVPLSCKDLRPEAHVMFRIWSGSITKVRTSRMSYQKIANSTGMSWEEIRVITEELADEGFLRPLENSSVLIVAPVCTCAEGSGTSCVRASAPVRSGVARRRGRATSSSTKEQSSVGATHPPADAGNFDRPASEWNAVEFARYLSRQINRKYRWGNGIGPNPVNHTAVAHHVKEWIRGGTDPVVIKRMIELFAADPRPYLRNGQPAWVDFVNSRQKLWEKAKRSVRSRQMIEHGDDRDALEGKGAWAKPPAYGPEYDDRDVLEGRKR